MGNAGIEPAISAVRGEEHTKPSPGSVRRTLLCSVRQLRTRPRDTTCVLEIVHDRLEDVTLVRRHLPEGASHILVLAALYDHLLYAVLVGGLRVVVERDDHTQRARQGSLVGEDAVGRRGDVVAARGRRVLHGDDDGFARVLFEVEDALVHLVARRHPAAGGVDLEHHGDHARVLCGLAQRIGEAFWRGGRYRYAQRVVCRRDNALDGHYGHLVRPVA